MYLKKMFISLLGILTLFMTMLNKVNGNEKEMVEKNELFEKTLFDFTKHDDTKEWIEQSDTVRELGMSKAVFIKQKTQKFERGIMFFLLNPQPNGAGFAGIRILRSFNLSTFENIEMKIRGQGENMNYKIVLRHKYLNDEPNPTYEQHFTAPFQKFEVVSLPFKEFKPFYRGKLVDNVEPLNTSKITSFGIQMYGGVYLDKKQKGVSTLEIDWIKVTR